MRRWWFLSLGIFIELLYGFLLISILRRVAECVVDGVPLGAQVIDIMMLWPKCFVMLAIGLIVIGWVWRNWHGNVHRMLLLRLLDAQQKQPAKDAHQN